MPRQGRVVFINEVYHVVQRGNYQQTIFEEREDFIKYSYWMNEYSRKYFLDIVAYCLMSNHVHFIVLPRLKESLARTFGVVHMRFAQYKNKKNESKGHLWQARFHSYGLDEMHMYQAIRYVERNPVKAGLVQTPWDYKWSSACEHVNEGRSDIKLFDGMGINKNDWKSYLIGDSSLKGAVP